MRLGTLFSGIGAPEQAAARVWQNHKVVFACEWDKYARQSYLANYEIDEAHFHKDVKELDGTQYQGKVDILIGGSPCQAFSIAGMRGGTDDERGQLIYQYVRVVDEVKAPVIVYENVKGMLSIDGGRTIKEFVTALREIGYYCHYEVLNTKDYGVPQNRERIFLVGFLDHEAYYRFAFAPKIPLEKRLKDILEDSVDGKYYLSKKLIQGFYKHKERHKNKGTGFLWQPKNGESIANAIRANAAICPTDNTIIEGHTGTGGQRGRVFNIGGCIGSLSATDYKDAQKILEGTRIRKLTPRECLRLQDFPDTFKQVVSDSQMYKQAGNAMSCNVVEMIFRQIDKALRGEEPKIKWNSLF